MVQDYRVLIQAVLGFEVGTLFGDNVNLGPRLFRRFTAGAAAYRVVVRYRPGVVVQSLRKKAHARAMFNDDECESEFCDFSQGICGMF